MTTAHPQSPQPTRWTREVAAAPHVRPACSANSIRLTTGASFGATACAFLALVVGLTVHDLFLLIAAIFLAVAAIFWYVTSRDNTRRHRALAREEDLVKSLTDIEDRLGGDPETRRRALADLAEWIALRSRLNGQFFDADAWRRFTHQSGSPMVVMLGLDAPPQRQLTPTYEELDLEQESPGLSRQRLLRLGAYAFWFALMAWGNPAPAVRLGLLAILIGAVAWEFGFTPAALCSAVISPGRIEVGAWRRTRAAEAGAHLAIIEHRDPAGAWGPPVTMLTLLGPGRKTAFAFRHKDDARIAQFLAAWLTPRAGEPAHHQDPADEPRSHHPPHAAVPAGSSGPAGRAST